MIVEDYIEGREFSVGVVDGAALPVIEMIPNEGFYDYQNKYKAGNTLEVCPADLPALPGYMAQAYPPGAFAPIRRQTPRRETPPG